MPAPHSPLLGHTDTHTHVQTNVTWLTLYIICTLLPHLPVYLAYPSMSVCTDLFLLMTRHCSLLWLGHNLLSNPLLIDFWVVSSYSLLHCCSIFPCTCVCSPGSFFKKILLYHFAFEKKVCLHNIPHLPHMRTPISHLLTLAKLPWYLQVTSLHMFWPFVFLLWISSVCALCPISSIGFFSFFHSFLIVLYALYNSLLCVLYSNAHTHTHTNQWLFTLLMMRSSL